MTNLNSSNESFGGRFVLQYRREEIEQAERLLLDEIEQRNFDRASLFAIRLALEEALSNAFRHGNKGDKHKKVMLNWRIDPNTVTIEVEDEGEGFDPDAVPDPTEQENVEIPSGRGLKLIRSFMSEVQIPPPGNRLRMVYVRPDST